MKKKLLIVIQLVRRGGVELVAINFARHIDLSKLDVSFLLLNPYENQDEALLNELKNEGFKFIEMPKECSGYLSKYRFMSDLMKKEKYDIVHSHVILFSGLVLRAAKKNGVRVRIAHSHVVKWNRQENFQYKIYKYVMQLLLNKYANYKLACCKAAGEFLYGKKQYAKYGEFIANGIDTKKFEFNLTKRKTIRDEFNIADDELLVGHVGSVYKIKNQTFLIDVFNDILKKVPNAKLILVGEIFEKEPVEEKINKHQISDKVIFAGQRNDIADIYQAMDIMIFPSLHEALPVSLIEAQASKLPCLISDSVTQEVKFNNNVDFMNLNQQTEKWTDRALELISFNRNNISVDNLVKTYDINIVTRNLEKIYFN